MGRNPWLCERCSRDATHTVFLNANAPEVAAHVVLPVERKPRYFASSWGHWVRVRSLRLLSYTAALAVPRRRTLGLHPDKSTGNRTLTSRAHKGTTTPTPQLPAKEIATVQNRCRSRFLIEQAVTRSCIPVRRAQALDGTSI